MRRPGLPKNYVGLDKDINGGMTMIGKIIRDAGSSAYFPKQKPVKAGKFPASMP